MSSMDKDNMYIRSEYGSNLKCPQCPKTYSRVDRLKNHVDKCHRVYKTTRESDIQQQERFAKGIYKLSENPHRVWVYKILDTKLNLKSYDYTIVSEFWALQYSSKRVQDVLCVIWNDYMTKWDKLCFKSQEYWIDFLTGVCQQEAILYQEDETVIEERFAKGIYKFSENPHRVWVYKILSEKLNRYIEPDEDEDEDVDVDEKMDEIWNELTYWEKLCFDFSNKSTWKQWLIGQGPCDEQDFHCSHCVYDPSATADIITTAKANRARSLGK